MMMGFASKALAALVIIGIAWLLIDGYGDARYDAGWQEATDAQREAAEELKQEAIREKAASDRRLAELDKILIGRMEELNKLKEEKLHSDETYARFRNLPVHRVTRCRIWPQLCDTPSGDGRVRTP